MFPPTFNAFGQTKSSLGKLLKMGGLTFYKDYQTGGSLNADSSVGSPVATFTATRAANAPATYVDGAGIVNLVTTSDIPRYQGGYYDATGFHAQKGLMIEAAGTNLAKQNTDMNNGPWAVWHATVVGYAPVAAPDGSSTAVEVSFSAADGSIYQGDIPVDTATYTVSYFVRAKTGTTTIRIIVNSAWSSDISVGVSWARVSWTLAQSATPTYVGVACNAAGDSANVYAWGMQIEKSPYATSFIPTTVAALTRGAEGLKYAIEGNRTAAAESIFIKFAPEWAAASPTTALHLLDSDADKVSLAFIAASDSFSYYPNATDDAATTVTDTVDPTINTSYVIGAVSYGATAGTNTEIYNAGVSKATSTTNYTAPDMAGASFYVGCRNDSTLQLDGVLQSCAFFSGVKSATDVVAITGIMNQ
jgi:hypothetical protein